VEETGRPPGSNEATIGRTLRSFRFAAAGLRYLVRTQPNFRVHLIAVSLVAILAGFLRVTALELAVLLLAIGLVLVAEAFNTVAEAIVDLASPTYHPLARIAKDAAAAGVLMAAIVAALVGLVLLGPPLLSRLFG
jgi:diacylglycerol kinase